MLTTPKEEGFFQMFRKVRHSYPPSLRRAVGILTKQLGRSVVSNALRLPPTTVYRWAEPFGVSSEQSPWPESSAEVHRLCVELGGDWASITDLIKQLLHSTDQSFAQIKSNAVPIKTTQPRIEERRMQSSRLPREPSTCYLSVKAYIDQSYRFPITTRGLATKFDLNQFSMIRAFRKTFGLPPHQYLLQVRVRHASEALAISTDDLETVAKSCGFGSRDSMSRAFKKFNGASPGSIPIHAPGVEPSTSRSRLLLRVAKKKWASSRQDSAAMKSDKSRSSQGVLGR